MTELRQSLKALRAFKFQRRSKIEIASVKHQFLLLVPKKLHLSLVLSIAEDTSESVVVNIWKACHSRLLVSLQALKVLACI